MEKTKRKAKQKKTGDKAKQNGKVVGEIVFIGPTNKIPKRLHKEISWFTSKEKKPFWIVIQLDNDIDCLSSWDSYFRIYQ